MPYDRLNNISYNHLHHCMLLLGDGGAIYTLGPQGNKPYSQGPSGTTYPPDPLPPLKVYPPSEIIGNYIHSAGPGSNPEHPGAGSHFPGGIYADEGSTNWRVTDNLVQNTQAWVQGCRDDTPWIDFILYADNSIVCDHLPPYTQVACGQVINNNTQCPLGENPMYNSTTELPAEALSIIDNAGPRTVYPLSTGFNES